MDERVERSRLLYKRARHNADPDALTEAERELDAAEADLALARGQIMHGRFLAQQTNEPAQALEDPQELAQFEHACQLYQRGGDLRGEAEALFWIGCFHQVVRRDNTTAVPVLERSLKLAAQAGDKTTMAEALRHLGIAEHSAGRLDNAKTRLEESVTLRRESGQPVGIAANLVGLAYIASGQGRHDDALTLLDEAGAITAAHGAHGISQHIEEARASVATAKDAEQP
jgi:tetratricopeptide (TPR) repeat protein